MSWGVGIMGLLWEHRQSVSRRGYPAQAGTSSPWQVLEERQRLWLAELKRLYVERLHEVAQKAERSERNLQLQLFMAQQEQRRLRKELRAQQGLTPEPRFAEADPNARPEEETRWEVRLALRNLVPTAVVLCLSPCDPDSCPFCTRSRYARSKQRLAS